MYDFENRTLLITGANGAIAKATARLFHKCGANLVLGDISENALNAFATELRLSGSGRIIAQKLDVTQSRDSQKIAENCANEFGKIDFLVTAAGVFPRRLFSDMDDGEWRQVLAVNLDGAFYISRALAPLLGENSAIVHIASLAAHIGSPEYAHYSAAKGGILSLSRSLAKELAPKTRVNAVSPGIIDTPMVETMLKREGDPWIEATMLKRIGRPEEVASVNAFLCSDAASYVTGETLHVNGGIYVG